MSEERREAAEDRAERAARRAKELGEFHDRLVTGEAPTEEDLARDRAAVPVAEGNARQAAAWSARAHERSAAVHRQAAEVARRSGDDEMARRHEIAAEEAETAARSETSE